jgi:O-succinylhomoserine sulfhydrylase
MKKGGNIISFEVKGGLDSGRKFINKIQLCSLSANLGDSRSIITHPSSTTHSKLSETEQLEVGITPGMIRLSVGLEHNEDIWNDLNKALHA